MNNVHRSDYVEAIVAVALAECGWSRTMPWSSWDFECDPDPEPPSSAAPWRRGRRIRMEVKQSAAEQPWQGCHPSVPPRSYDIKERKETWEPLPPSECKACEREWTSARRIDKAGRPADVYVFAWHGGLCGQADHADPGSWEFFVVPEDCLPPGQKSIALNAVRSLARERGKVCRVDELCAALDPKAEWLAGILASRG